MLKSSIAYMYSRLILVAAITAVVIAIIYKVVR